MRTRTNLGEQVPEPAATDERTSVEEERRGHMIVVGNDALTLRLVEDLAGLYREQVVVIVPDARASYGPQLVALGREEPRITVLTGRRPDEATLTEARIGEAASLALVVDDDQAVTQAALVARTLNATVRLALRVHNQALGARLTRLLDREDAPATAASASDTAAPALVSAALPNRRLTFRVDGGTCSVLGRNRSEEAEEQPARHEIPIALLTEDSGVLLPREEDLTAGAPESTVLRILHHRDPERRRGLLRVDHRRFVAGLRSFFSRKLLAISLALALVVVLLTVLTWQLTGHSLGLSFFYVLLDLGSAGNPATDPGDNTARQVLQVVTVFTGIVLLGTVAAVMLDNLGALRTTPSPRRVPRTMNKHVVLIGLGKVGSTVVERLHDMRVPVVVVERNPSVPGLTAIRERGIPVVVGEFARRKVFRAARVDRAQALMALTNNDSANLQAVLYAREQQPELRVVLRLFDEEFATTVYRSLRAAHPDAKTRSRSVSYLAAPAFAAAMMGRQVLAAIPAKRELLLVADVAVRDQSELYHRTVGEAFHPGAWRVVGIRRWDGSLEWNPGPDRQLRGSERVVVVATREGLGRLLRRPEPPAERSGAPATDRAGDPPAPPAPRQPSA